MTLWQLDFGGGLYLQNALGASLELPAYALMKARRRSAPARPALAPPTPGPRPEGGCMALYDVWRVWLYAGSHMVLHRAP